MVVQAGVGNDLHILGVGILVYAHNEGGGLSILGGGGDDDLLGAAFQVGLAAFSVVVNTPVDSTT